MRIRANANRKAKVHHPVDHYRISLEERKSVNVRINGYPEPIVNLIEEFKIGAIENKTHRVYGAFPSLSKPRHGRTQVQSGLTVQWESGPQQMLLGANVDFLLTKFANNWPQTTR